MTCERCKGLMVEEWRPDFSPETYIWRCLNCGAITDPLIVSNRLSSQRRGKQPALNTLDVIAARPQTAPGGRHD